MNRLRLMLLLLSYLSFGGAEQKLSAKECENAGFTGLALCSDCRAFAEYVKDEARLRSRSSSVL
ncbi:hypothetical protein M569_17131 [Genlisea aurea]|uniref:Uncharacterized protein n=1 Tax=Genlisea aurea TaxID=192259 RepID=S8BZP3_9LAMI|nr:hypothetical protein M569_17131 [Genlisea aurea]